MNLGKTINPRRIKFEDETDMLSRNISKNTEQTLRKNSEDGRPQPQGGGSLKFRNTV